MCCSCQKVVFLHNMGPLIGTLLSILVTKEANILQATKCSAFDVLTIVKTRQASVLQRFPNSCFQKSQFENISQKNTLQNIAFII